MQTNKNRGIIANIDLKLSSKEDKITHRSEILIRFYQGQKIDFRVKTGLFIQPRHFKYFVNRAATKKQRVDIPDKITSVCKDEAKAKRYVVTTRGEVVITDRLITPDVLYDKEQARLLVDLQTIIMDAFVKVDKKNIPDDWLDKIVRKFHQHGNVVNPKKSVELREFPFMIWLKDTWTKSVSPMTIQKPLGFLCVTWPAMKLSRIRFLEKSLHGTSTR